MWGYNDDLNVIPEAQRPAGRPAIGSLITSTREFFWYMRDTTTDDPGNLPTDPADFDPLPPNSAGDPAADPRFTLTRPHNAETFLLMTAGPDNTFGTEDDICNFPFNPL